MPVRAPFPTFFNFVLFTVIFLRFLQFLKAFFPIEVTFFPIVTLFNFLQPSKLPVPISVTVSGITTVCSFLLFLNAFAAMPVTRYFTLLIVTVFGIVTFFAFFSLADSFVSVTDGFPLEESDFVTLYSLPVFSFSVVPAAGTFASGVLEGAADGFALGCSLGVTLGAADGAALGFSLGVADGATDGCSLGFGLGDADGADSEELQCRVKGIEIFSSKSSS